MGNEPAPPQNPLPWPITVTARWTDPGYSVGDARITLAVVLTIAWFVAVLWLIDGELAEILLLLGIAMLGTVAVPWLRRHAREHELMCSPTSVRLLTIPDRTDLVIGRESVGILASAESGMDTTEPFVLVTDQYEKTVFRVRSGRAQLRFDDLSGISAEWWAAHMPAGTTPETPPVEADVVALLASWWPAPSRRISVRGTAHIRRRWLEGDLRTRLDAIRGSRRLGGGLLAGLIVFIWALAIPSVRAPTVGELIAVVPPTVAGLIVALRALAR